MAYDTIIRNGRWFDGTGGPSAIRNIGIRDGRVSAVTPDGLDEADCPQVIDASGKWVLPGLLDIHTHYDVEVLDGPGLPESLRHGVTTVMLGSCSLSTVYVGGVDAGDLFGRVEAIPRDHVIAAVDKHKTWSSCAEYVAALEALPLGPNVAAFLGHSDMRTATMGLDRATRKTERPTATEQARMEQMLVEALDAGFVGMSSQQLLFDKLDGDTCRSRTLPSTYAKPRELRRLKALLRRSGRILQSGPDIANPMNIGSQVVQSLGVLRKPLRTSLLSAADVKTNPFVIHVLGPVARLVTRLGGDFRWQHLPVPFTVYADGIDLVVFEEFGSGAAALHLRDQLERNALMRDESYRRRFRKDYDSKFGVRVWHRDFFDAEIVACPDASVVGKSFGQVGVDRGGLHPVDAFLDLVLEHGTALRWRTTISNDRPDVLKKLAREPGVQMGFSDAGAHLRNMAFYNSGLRLLRHVRDAGKAGRPFMTIEHAVHRLTGELADWYHLDAGHLREGDRADLVIVDPEHLDAALDEYAEAPIDQFGGMSRMVNRNNATVNAVFVGGRAVFLDGSPTELLGKQRTGSFLRAKATGRRRKTCWHMPVDDGSSAKPVLGLWQALSRRDWDAVKTFLSADCIYVDMPVGPTLAARGPDDIVKRLMVGLGPLADYANHDGLLLSNGSDVMYEHSETWRWVTGETALLKFVSVHKVEDGKVTLWKDYWDLGSMVSQAPATWMDDLAGTDTSWIFDATGLI